MTVMRSPPSPPSMPAPPRRPKRIEVEYEVLPHVIDVDEATKPSAPFCMMTSSPAASIQTRKSPPTSLIARNSAMATSTRVSRMQRSSSSAASRPSRPIRAISSRMPAWRASIPTEQAELWVCTQGHFVYRQKCADLLGMDVSKLRVTSSEIGGGFGGKTHVWMEPVALALSRKAGRPVKLVMSREEVFRASGPTSATSIDVKIGARKDGTITAALGDTAVFLRTVSRHMGRAWRHDGLCLLRPQECQIRGIRSACQPAQDSGLSSTRRRRWPPSRSKARSMS